MKTKSGKKKGKKLTGNQYPTDPNESIFLKAYLDPKSSTIANAYQSAMGAGYEENYAKCILSKDLDWLAENVRDEQMIKLAENNLREGMETDHYEVDDKGVLRINGSVFKTKLDVSKFVSERLNKEKYSQKVETKLTARVKSETTATDDDIDIDKLAKEVAKALKIKKTK